MRDIAGLEECVSGLIDGCLITLYVGEFTGHYHPDARTGMMVITDVSSGLIGDFGNPELELAIQIGNVPRDNLF